MVKSMLTKTYLLMTRRAKNRPASLFRTTASILSTAARAAFVSLVDFKTEAVYNLKLALKTSKRVG